MWLTILWQILTKTKKADVQLFYSLSETATPHLIGELKSAYHRLKEYINLEITPFIFALPNRDHPDCLSKGLYCTKKSSKPPSLNPFLKETASTVLLCCRST